MWMESLEIERMLDGERQSNESRVDALRRLIREADAHRIGTSVPEPAPVDYGEPVWPMVINDLIAISRNRCEKACSLVIEDCKARDAFGRKKYGMPLVLDNGRNHVRDLYQELLDAMVYAKAALVVTGLGRNVYEKLIRLTLEARTYL